MIYGLKGLLGEITGCDDHRRILSRFFDDFVERILVQDYKRLKTRNNSFRYRQQILQRVRELEYDLERKEALVAGYLEQTGESDSESAWQSINADYYRDKDQKEVDLLIVQDGTLYPVEIKRSASPSAMDLRHFGALQRLGMPIGPGGVICLTSQAIPLTRELLSIPVAAV